MEHAVELMSKHPGARLGPFEIRPVDEAMNQLIKARQKRAQQGETMTNEKTQNCENRRDLVFRRVFPAPLKRVWKTWTDSEDVKRWWGPNHFTCPIAKIDFREGGKSLVCMRAPQEFGGQDMYSTWTYTKIEPLARIDWIHHFADKDGGRVDPTAQGLPADMPAAVRNSAIFKSAGDNKTEVTVTEYDWPVGQMMELSKQGMEQCLDKMGTIFDKP